MATIHLWVEGIVQGVFFRDTTRRLAQELGLSGWVKNLSDGRVEAVFHGDKAVCEEAVSRIRSFSPPIRIDKIEHRWDDDGTRVAGFKIRY